MIEQERRENVIKGLECCIGFGDNYCDVCPYSLNEFECDREKLKADALNLLKEQKETIPIDFLMRYSQLPTEFAISAWEKPIMDALKKEAKDTDKPMSFDDALQLVNGILPINRGEEM